MYKLNLTKYTISITQPKRVDKNIEMVTEDEEYPLRQNLEIFCCLEGIHKTGADFVQSVMLGKKILDCKEDFIELTDKEYSLLQTVIDNLVARPYNPEGKSFSLGGKTHQEIICRVVKAEKIV